MGDRGHNQCYLSNVNDYENGNDYYLFTKMNTKMMPICQTIMMPSETYRNENDSNENEIETSMIISRFS